MVNGAVLLKWRDRNWAEHGHYIYRSDTPMDINNLPSPVATLNTNQYEYIDYDVIADQTYYYRIGAFRNNDVSVSEEIEVIASPWTVNIYDIFMDGSEIATFNYDTDGNDLNDIHNPVSSLGSNFTDGIFDGGFQAYDPDSGDVTYFNYGRDFLTGETIITISLWVKLLSTSWKGATNRGWLVSKTLVGNDNGRIGIGFINTGNLSIIDGVDGVDTTYQLGINKWEHITVTWNQLTSTVSIYEGNGNLVQTVTSNFVPLKNHSFMVGSIASTTGAEDNNSNPHAVIDQMRIFNRELSVPEIQLLHREQQ